MNTNNIISIYKVFHSLKTIHNVVIQKQYKAHCHVLSIALGAPHLFLTQFSRRHFVRRAKNFQNHTHHEVADQDSITHFLSVNFFTLRVVLLSYIMAIKIHANQKPPSRLQRNAAP